MKYQLVLWDFDGTLADTLTLALGIYNRMAEENGYVKIDDPHSVRHMGMRDFLKSHNIPMYRIPLVFSAFLKELRSFAADIELQEGVAILLGQISQLGIRQGIVSSNSTDTIRTCLLANVAEAHFQYVSGTSGIFGKEKRIKTALRTLNVPTAQTLYVGDEIRDIEVAQAAGVDIAAVTWGLNTEEALSSRKPNHLISRPSDLLPILQK